VSFQVAMAAGPGEVRKVQICNVVHDGVTGRFCANAESLGWQADDGSEAVVHSTTSVRKAEWLDGQLRVLCEPEDSANQAEVLALEGFAPGDYETIWRYFEQACSVYVKKHRVTATLSETDFDNAMRAFEEAADRVDEAPSGGVQKKGREFDLLKKVETFRDGLDQAVSGDKQALSRVFAANSCERICRLRLVLDTVQLETYRRDPRWLHLRNMCATVEAVLKELGTFKQWQPPDDVEHSSMLRRVMVRELQVRQGAADEDFDAAVSLPSPPIATQDPVAVSNDPLSSLRSVVAKAVPAPVPVASMQAPPPLPPPAETPVPTPVGTAGDAAIGDCEDGDNTAEGDADDEDEEVTNPNSALASALDKAPATRTHPGSILEGWVWKRSRFLRRWRRRWLVLLPRGLYSYKKRGDLVATETVMAGSVTRVYNADSEVLQTRSFAVALRRRTHFMVSDDENQKQAWMREITRALGSGGTG